MLVRSTEWRVPEFVNGNCQILSTSNSVNKRTTIKGPAVLTPGCTLPRYIAKTVTE
jgi:hypothetical protein